MLKPVAFFLRSCATCSVVASLLAGGLCPANAQEVSVEHFNPEPIRIEVEDLPAPYATRSIRNSPQVVSPDDDARLNVPQGFKVIRYAEVPSARWLAFTPEGELLCAASQDETIYLLKDKDNDGVAETKSVFLNKDQGANRPFGMAFANDSFYLGNMDAVLRYSCERDGEEWKLGDPSQFVELPEGGYNQHWTRNVVLSPDGKWLYVTVGSKTNADPEPEPRASVFRVDLEGENRKTIATGLRNPVGMAFHPESKEPYVAVNERDGLGDDLVPDYLTRIQEGEFYGWPYAYLKPDLLDPRLVRGDRSIEPDLAKRTKTPDVLFEAHSAALGLDFARGNLPQRYRNGAFCAFRGSWNRSRGTGYKIVFVPFGEDNRPLGHYEDFVTGFLTDPEGPTTWGRPVGVAVSKEGDIYFTEEANGYVYRVVYEGDDK